MTKKGLTQLILSVLLMSAFGPITYVAKSAETSIDVALAIEAILYGAQYGGSTTQNTKEQYDQLRWNDTRISKPTWEALLNAWNNLLASRVPKKIESSTAQLDPTTQSDTKTVTTKTESVARSETRTAQVAEVASISNIKERTVAAVEMIKTFNSVEKEQALNVTYESKKSSVIDVDLAVPGIPVVVTATKKGSPTITLKSTTDDEGDAQIKTTRNLEGYSVTLALNKVKIDTDVVKKKK